MKRGSVVVDVAIDQGGCFETSHATTHTDPIYFVDNVLHYCVSNMPAAVPHTSTFALTNATFPYLLELANKGVEKACAQSSRSVCGREHVSRRSHAFAASLNRRNVPGRQLRTLTGRRLERRRKAVSRYCRRLCTKEIRRWCARWTSGVLHKDLLRQLFELGLMGIEIPEQYGGQGGNFFQCVLAIEEISAVDPAVAVVVDVQNTIVNNAILRWGREDQKSAYLPRLALDTVGAYALSEAGSGSDAFALATTAQNTGRPLHPQRPQSCGSATPNEAGLFVLVRQCKPGRWIPGHHGVS